MNAIQNIARQMSRLLIVAGVSALTGAATAPVHAQTGATVRTQKPTYAPNEKIVVEYAGLPGNQSDWITVVKADASDGSYGPYFYTNGKRDGSFNYDGLPAGQYQARVYFNWSGNGGYTVQARAAFTVGASTTPVNPPTTTTATADYNGVWSTDLGLYLGLVQTTDQSGRQVVRGYYWWDGQWYLLLSGVATGRVLEGRWDASVADGTFRFTMAPDGKGFDAVATGLYGMVELTFKGGLYSRWQ